jgi:DNA-binding response OmpR family regulator
MKILFIDDDAEIREFLKDHLPRHGFLVDMGKDGSEAIHFLRTNRYDLVILDLNLPDMGGEELIAEAQSLDPVPPTLMLSVVSTTESKIRLLNAGADDYLVKPFRLDELVARIRALLRRPRKLTPEVLVAGDLVLDVAKQTVRYADTSISLTRKEFLLLSHLLRNTGDVISKESLIDHVWESSHSRIGHSIDTHIYTLRKKLNIPELIQTIHNVGYKIDY